MQKKVNFTVVLCAAFSLLYIFFAVRPLSREIHFLTRWTVDSNKSSPETDSSQPDSSALIPFKLGQTAGYFTQDGRIASVFTFPYKIALSRDNYCIYGTSDKTMNVYSAKGEKLSEITSSGFPYFQDDRKFLMLPGGNSFACLSEDSKIKWTYENYVPLTAFDSSAQGIAAGYADGSILVFDGEGTVQQNFFPGGSEYPVILGLAVSDDANMTASISGLNSQRFILAEKESGHTKITYHEYLEAQTTEQCLVKFSRDSSHVYFAHKNCLGVADCRKLTAKHIKIPGKILSICESETDSTIFVLSSENLDSGLRKYHVSILQNFNICSDSFSFTAQNAFITVKGNSLFTGRDSSISRIDVTYR